MLEVMRAQDCLYTLVVKNLDGSTDARVIGSLVDYLFAPEDPEAVLDRMTDPATRIVSLTITEGGYHVNQADGSFDDSDPADPGRHRGATGRPTTAFGFITEALSRRRAAGTEPFTVMSCDNIQGNGTVARDMITAFATLRDEELGGWIGEHVAFPNSMVDRITPVTTDADRELVSQEYGIDDGWPVVCEPFAQWALEDNFPLGRPEFERVGVQVVDDVEPYELMKLRLLNASHQAMGYLGYLSGYRYAHEVASDPLFTDFLLGYMDHEATPTLAPVPGVDLDDYKHQLIERFANPEIKDTLARLCAESSDRIPKWLVPVIKHQLAARRGGTPQRARGRRLGSLRRGRRRVGRPDRRGRPATRPADGARPTAGRRATRLPRGQGPVRRPQGPEGVHRPLPRRAGVAARARRPSDAGGVAAGVS